MEEAGDGNQPVTKRVRKEHVGEVDIDIEFFDHEDEHAPEVGPSQKATKGDDAGVPVHFWDDRIQEQLTGHWAVKENLKGVFQSNFGQNFDKAVDRRILKRLLEALRKLSLGVWKSNVRRDFEAWYDVHGKVHLDQADIKRAGEEAIL